MSGARRRLLFWGTLTIAIAGAVVWRAAEVRRAFGEATNATHAMTVPGVVTQAASWGRARAALAETIAALVARDVAAGDPQVEARFAAAMDVLARREGFVRGRVLDARGAAVGAAGARDATDTIAATGPPAPAARATAVRCGEGFCAEFHAPVVADGRIVGAVVLVAPVDARTFEPLNTSRAGVRTLRTTVLAPLERDGAPAAAAAAAAAETLAVVATLGTPGSPAPPAVLAVAALPAHVRRQLRARPGAIAIDTAPGLHGPVTHYAVARIPGLDWLVLREFDRSEVLRAARGALLVEEPILVALLVSLVALVRHRLRARRARRDQELTRLRADFVASTSHELRTPLAQIRMFAELLQKGTLRDPAESARALRIIEKEASRLTILVDNLLNYARLRRRADDAAAAEALAPVRVADEVAHVIDAFAPLAAERGVRVAATVDGALHARVDSLALRQVLTNFLENAVKYGPRAQQVTVGASADERCVRVWVDDEGDGVPPAERAVVWEAFRRGQAAEASGQGGSGIGLAVVRELALQYGGGVAVEDAPAGGARFVVEFPRA